MTFKVGDVVKVITVKNTLGRKDLAGEDDKDFQHSFMNCIGRQFLVTAIDKSDDSICIAADKHEWGYWVDPRDIDYVSIEDEKKNGFDEGWNAALVAFEEEFIKLSNICWEKYDKDKFNNPMPSFTSAIALVVAIRDKLEKE